MMNKKYGLGMLAGVLLVAGLMGCGGSKQADAGSGSSAAPATTPQDAVQKRLNDPSVSPQEKDMIRRSQGGAAGTAPAAGGTSDSGK